MYSKFPEWIHSFTSVNDKGTLLVYEKKCLPFVPKRIFWVTDVPKLAKRGGHAHKECEQFLFCVNGGVEIKIDGQEDTYNINEHSLVGLYVPPMYWLDLRFLRPKSKIVVLCSHEYSEEEYLRNYDEFKRMANPV